MTDINALRATLDEMQRAAEIEAEIATIKEAAAKKVRSLQAVLNVVAAATGVRTAAREKNRRDHEKKKSGGPVAKFSVGEARLKLFNAIADSGPMAVGNVPAFLNAYPSHAAMAYEKHSWFAVENGMVKVTPAGRKANE